MSKAVLVVDMPDSCAHCKLFCRGIDGTEGYCEVMNEPDDNSPYRTINCEDGYCQNKPNWCPLISIPEELHNKGMYE